MKFNEKLQMLRKEKGMSQEGLAEMLGVSRQAISKWESGAAFPETEKMIALCDIFGVTLDSLIRDGETRNGSYDISGMPLVPIRGYSYEYKSEKKLLGLPLVHISIGRGAKRAKGIVAIGNIATGAVSIGLLSSGILSIGVASAGLLSFGSFSLGLLLSMGAISIGAFSFGAIALGLVTFGAVSVGLYSVGAFAAAARVAVGDHAYGTIAVGRVARGMIEFVDTSANRDFSSIPVKEVREAILSEYPGTWGWIVNLMTFWGK